MSGFPSSTTVTIRAAEPRDADGIAGVFLESAGYHAELDPERYRIPDAAEVVARYGRVTHQQNADAITLIAESGGVLVGFVDARLEKSPDLLHRDILYCHVSEIAIGNRYQSQGVGGELLRAVEEWGRQHGAAFASLEHHVQTHRGRRHPSRQAMLIKPIADIASSKITDKKHYVNRRDFLRAAGITAAAVAGGVAAAGSIVEAKGASHGRKFPNISRSFPRPNDKVNSWDDITSYNNFYEFGIDKADPGSNSGRFVASPWKVAIEGECKKVGVMDLEDILKGETLEERVYRHRSVEAWSMVIPWVGFPLANLIKKVELTSRAKYVEFTSLADSKMMPGVRYPILNWPYREGLRLDEAMHPLTLMVVGLYDEILPAQDGAPLRLAVPWKYGFKHAKSIVKIRFAERQPLNSWQEQAANEYGFYANVSPTVDHPRWSQGTERRIGEFFRRKTLMFNGYADQVQSLYAGMDLRKNY